MVKTAPAMPNEAAANKKTGGGGGGGGGSFLSPGVKLDIVASSSGMVVVVFG